MTQRQSDEIKRLTQARYLQGEQVNRISSWAAIVFAPILVPTLYRMKFEHMLGLGWRLGCPLALVTMLAMFALLYAFFRRHG